MTANQKLADKAFAASRQKFYGNSVKSLLERAVARTRASYEVCRKPATDQSEGSRAIARLAIVLEGRLAALEIVLEAMKGNKARLRHWASE